MGDSDDLRGHDDIICTFIGIPDTDEFSAGVDDHGDLQEQPLSASHFMIALHGVEDLEHIFLDGLRVTA